MVIQNLATACAVLRDPNPTPIFPRWLGYWLVLSVLGTSLSFRFLFFLCMYSGANASKALLPSFYAHVELQGAGAWNGVIGFQISTIIFGYDMILISWFVWKSAGQSEERVEM